MKLISSNGKELTVRELGDLVARYKVKPGGPPIKLNGRFVKSDAEAEELVQSVIAGDHYERVEVG